MTVVNRSDFRNATGCTDFAEREIMEYWIG
jgi:hypothetical protein